MHPFLMLTAIAFFNPTVCKCKAFELFVSHVVSVENGSKICHHFIHLIGINRHAIPCHAILSLPEVATNLPVTHAAHELIPRGLIVTAILYTCLGSVVKKFIVANPQGSVPSLVGCPTVVGAEGAGHVVVCCVDVVSIGSKGGVQVTHSPVCESSVGDVQISQTIPKQAHLITTTHRDSRGRTRAPVDLNVAMPQGQDDQINSG